MWRHRPESHQLSRPVATTTSTNCSVQCIHIAHISKMAKKSAAAWKNFSWLWGGCCVMLKTRELKRKIRAMKNVIFRHFLLLITCELPSDVWNMRYESAWLLQSFHRCFFCCKICRDKVAHRLSFIRTEWCSFWGEISNCVQIRKFISGGYLGLIEVLQFKWFSYCSYMRI